MMTEFSMESFYLLRAFQNNLIKFLYEFYNVQLIQGYCAIQIVTCILLLLRMQPFSLGSIMYWKIKKYDKQIIPKMVNSSNCAIEVLFFSYYIYQFLNSVLIFIFLNPESWWCSSETLLLITREGWCEFCFSIS